MNVVKWLRNFNTAWKLLNYYCIFWCVLCDRVHEYPFTLNASIRAYGVLFFIEDSIAIKIVLYPTPASQYDINHSKCNTLNHKNCRANFQRKIVTSHHTVPAAFSYILIATLSRAFNFNCTLFFDMFCFYFVWHFQHHKLNSRLITLIDESNQMKLTCMWRNAKTTAFNAILSGKLDKI